MNEFLWLARIYVGAEVLSFLYHRYKEFKARKDQSQLRFAEAALLGHQENIIVLQKEVSRRGEILEKYEAEFRRLKALVTPDQQAN